MPCRGLFHSLSSDEFDKDALTSKSFAIIVRLKSKILFFSNKLVSEDQSVQTEDW